MLERRWAARYVFCDALWRGRARLLVDHELEDVMRAVATGGETFDDDPTRELLEALLPRERGTPVWMFVRNDEAVRLFSPRWPGVRFSQIGAAIEAIGVLPWESAMVVLSGSDDEDDGTDVGGPMRTSVDAGGRYVIGRMARAWIDALGETLSRGRTAMLVSPRADDPALTALSELLDASMPAVRMFGMYVPSVLGFVEMDRGEGGEEPEASDGGGEISRIPTWARAGRIDVEDDADDGGDELGREDDGVPLSFDNSLAQGAPRLVGVLAVVGRLTETAEGLTLVEVDAGNTDEAGSTDLRRVLGQLRRQHDLVALERQRAVEQLDALQAENATLREALGELRDQLANGVEATAAADAERLDAALSREQSLRWRVAALERELAALRVRPVDELEAELASLRLQVAAPPAVAPAELAPGAPPGARPRAVAYDAARRLAVGAGHEGGRTAALRVIDGLLRRQDRGPQVAALRRKLRALRRRLGG